MKYVWVAIAAICMIVAIVLVIQLNYETAFVVAAIGAVAWFLNFRKGVKTRLGNFDDENDNSDKGPGVNDNQESHDSSS